MRLCSPLPLILYISAFVQCVTTVSVSDLEDVVLWQDKEIQRLRNQLADVQTSAQTQKCSSQPETETASSTPEYLAPYKAMVQNNSRLISMESPRLFVMEDFLNATECDHIVKVSKPLLRESAVVGATDGAGLRKSKSAFLPRSWERGSDKIVTAVIQRIHQLFMVPLDFGEELQVTSYDVLGDKYEFHKDSDSQVGRMATFLVYLNEVESGGETIFPAVKPQFTPTKRKGKRREDLARINYNIKDHPLMTDYCNSDDFFKVTPKKGTAVVFFNHLPDLRADPYSLHGACPLKKGKKIVAQRWLRFWNFNEGNRFYQTFIKGSRFE